MLFNSISFALFLPIVFFLYWFIANKSLKFQNILLLTSSYFFYGCWDWRFLFLLVFSTALDYFTGLKMVDAKTLFSKKFWFWLSIFVNLGFLGVFKYYNFFVSTFANALLGLGVQADFSTLNVILPVGISFYTFHGLSYVIDIYNNRIKPERNFINYSVFVCFFPLLVAGPIERATHLLPQIIRKREFNYHKATDGLRQILWGLFKKIVIADNCASFVNQIFSNYHTLNGSTLLVAAILFAFQIYCDFSGYSDIALGAARLFGIELLRNFAFPYFSRDIAEFWRRWHISLTTWFRDYLYIPLGGSRGTKIKVVRNTFIIFLVSGFWHGANWTFLAWGALHAMLFLPLILLKRNRYNTNIVAQDKLLPSWKEFFQMGTTFLLVVITWIFFRANTLSDAIEFCYRIASYSLFTLPQMSFSILNISIIAILVFFIIIEWVGRNQQYAIANLGFNHPKVFRYFFYYFLIMLIIVFKGNDQQFIYFQF